MSVTEKKTATLRAQEHGHPPVICLQGAGQTSQNSQGCGFSEGGVAYTVNTVDRHAVCYPINLMVATRGGRDDMRTTFGIGEDGDPQFTLQANHEHAVCYAIDQQGGKGGANWMKDKMCSLCSDSHGTPHAVCYQAENITESDRGGAG